MRLQIGRRTLLGVNDGDFRMSRRFLGDAAHAALAGPDGIPHLPIGAFLVLGSEPVLIDAGLGPDLDNRYMNGGALPAELRKQGVPPEDVRHLALSHLHADHIGWVATERAGVTFPNAQVYLSQRDWDHFLVEDHEPKPPAWVRAALLDLLDAGRVTLFDGEHVVVNGVVGLPAPGHTPGHTVYAVHDGPDRAVLFGDAIYCPQQLTEKDWESVSDVDADLARRTREQLFRDLEHHDSIGVGAHFPGLVGGRVLAGAWLPHPG